MLRALHLGDLLCAVPALRALRARHARARIALVGLRGARQVVARFPHLVDELLLLPGVPGLPEQRPDARAVDAFVAAMRARRFDLALQLHGSGEITNPLVRAFGAQHTAGLTADPAPLAGGSDEFFPYPADVHEIERPLRLLEHLGIDRQGTHLEPLVPPTERGEIACLHPGARDPARRWPPDAFATVATALVEAGLTVVLTGTRAETDVTDAVMRRLPLRVQQGVVDTAHLDLPLVGFARLIASARLLVCNDTGASHVAAAQRTPSVVVFTASSPARWAPLDDRRHIALGPQGQVAPSDVMHAARELLSEAM